MKSLVIVTEKGLEKYADYLIQLISMKDDSDNEIVGTKDGEVVATVLTEEAYKNNQKQLTSEQYTLFVGNGKLAKEKRSFMKQEYNEFGMVYGSLGKQACLYVSEKVKKKEYNKFIEMAQKLGADIDKKALGVEDVADAVKGAAIGAAVETGAAPFGVGIFLISSVFAPIAAFVGASAAGAGLVLTLKDRARLKEQQYGCLILKYYLEGLRHFLDKN